MKLDSSSARVPASLHRFASAFVLIAAASAATAHPGHSITDATTAHIVSSPFHLAVLTGAGLLVFGSGWCIKRQTPRRAMQYVGVIAMAAALLLWGLRA